MSVSHHTGDIFATEQPAIAHGVNVQGVMGAGIAKTIKRDFPDVFAPYRKACRDSRHAHQLTVGGMLPTWSEIGQRWILNCASQDFPGPNARLTWLRSSVTAACVFCEQESISGFAVPRIGAGLGALAWNDVSHTLMTIANDHPSVDMEIWSRPGDN